MIFGRFSLLTLICRQLHDNRYNSLENLGSFLPLQIPPRVKYLYLLGVKFVYQARIAHAIDTADQVIAPTATLIIRMFSNQARMMSSQ